MRTYGEAPAFRKRKNLEWAEPRVPRHEPLQVLAMLRLTGRFLPLPAASSARSRRKDGLGVSSSLFVASMRSRTTTPRFWALTSAALACGDWKFQVMILILEPGRAWLIAPMILLLIRFFVSREPIGELNVMPGVTL